jgi:hypothetical protein
MIIFHLPWDKSSVALRTGTLGEHFESKTVFRKKDKLQPDMTDMTDTTHKSLSTTKVSFISMNTADLTGHSNKDSIWIMNYKAYLFIFYLPMF